MAETRTKKRFGEIGIEGEFEWAQMILKKTAKNRAIQVSKAESATWKQITSFREFMFNSSDMVTIVSNDAEDDGLGAIYNWMYGVPSGASAAAPDPDDKDDDNAWSYHPLKDLMRPYILSTFSNDAYDNLYFSHLKKSRDFC